MVKIAVIDSGVDTNICDCYQIFINNSQQTSCYTEHGTAMFSVLRETLKNKSEIISINIINKSGGIDDIRIGDIIEGIRIANDWGADIINISAGIEPDNINNGYDEINKLNAICLECYYKGTAIVAAVNNKFHISYPWCCSGVIKVLFVESVTEKVSAYISDYYGGIIEIHKKYIKGAFPVSGTSMYRSNSAAAAYLTGIIANHYETNKNKAIDVAIQKIINNTFSINTNFYKKIFEGVQIVTGSFDYLKRRKRDYGRVALVPFSKEIKSILKYSDLNVVAVFDARVKGYIGKDPYVTLGMNASTVRIKSRIDEIDADTLLIGYLDKVSTYDNYFDFDNLLEIALKKRLNVYSFLPVSQNWKRKFEESHLFIESAPIIKKRQLNLARRYCQYGNNCKCPIVAVLGTSSNQGKLTLEIKLNNLFKKSNYNTISIGTEHQACFNGIDYCYPFGYGACENVSLDLEDQIDYISRMITYISCEEQAELMLIAGQSRLLPYDITEESGIANAMFLEGVKPDCAILVINPYIDPKQYIADNIVYLERIFKCKVISLAYSDHTYKHIGNTSIYSRVLDQDKCKINDYYQKEFKREVGCIADDNFVSKIVECIFEFLQDKEKIK